MNGATLRVLVVLPLYGGSLPVGRYCIAGLRELGHTVEAFESPDFYTAFSALRKLRITADRLEQAEAAFLDVLSQCVLAKVESFEPDLVLSMAQAPLSRQALKQLRKDGTASAMWFVEDYRLFTYWRAFAPYYDFFFVIQQAPFLEELRASGVQNACYLPLAALPSFHRPLDLSSAERRQFGSDLSFLGAGYPNRRIAFRQLTSYDFKIWGSDWEDEVVLGRFLQEEGARISPEKAVKIFNASKINLNLHSSVQTRRLVSGGDFVNPRTFEIAACGAFQLVDRRRLLPELFTEDEMATFSDMDELHEKITYYLKNSEERLAVAAKGRKRTLAEHTYKQRMARLLDFVRERREGWPARRVENPLLADVPEALRIQLNELSARLELPTNAGFGDVISRLREQSGVLSDLETSLLFLDEWRKQYRKQ